MRRVGQNTIQRGRFWQVALAVILATAHAPRALAVAPGAPAVSPQVVERALGVQLSRAGRHREAADTFQKILQAHPDDVETLTLLASEYELLGDAGNAITVLEKLQQASPASVTSSGRLRLLRLYARHGRKSEAKEGLRSLSVDALSGAEQVDVAGILIELGDINRAQTILQGLDSETRSTARARELLALTLAKTGHHREAAEMLKSLVKDFPDRKDLPWQVVAQFNEAGDKRIALEFALMVVEGDTNQDHLLLVAQLAFGLKEYELAEKMIMRIPPGERKPAADLLLAQIYALRGMLAHAIHALEDALHRHPDNRDIRRSLVSSMLDAGWLEKALCVLGPLCDAPCPSTFDLELAIRAYRLTGMEERARKLVCWLECNLPRKAKERLDVARFFVSQGESAAARRTLSTIPPPLSCSREASLICMWAAVENGTKSDAIVQELRAFIGGRLCLCKPPKDKGGEIVSPEELVTLEDNRRLDALDLLLTLGDTETVLLYLDGFCTENRSHAYRAALLCARAEVAGPGRIAQVRCHLAKGLASSYCDLPPPAEIPALFAEIDDVAKARELIGNPKCVDDPAKLVLLARLRDQGHAGGVASPSLAELAKIGICRPEARLDMIEGLLDLGDYALAQPLIAKMLPPPLLRVRRALYGIRRDYPLVNRPAVFKELEAIAHTAVRGADETLALAESAMLVGNFRIAIAALDTVPTVARSLFHYRVTRAIAEYARQEPGRADLLVAQILKKREELPKRQLSLVEVLVSARRFPEAQSAFLAVAPAERDAHAGLRVRTSLDIVAHRGKSAFAGATQLAKLRPLDPEAYSLVCQALLLLKQFPEARAMYEQALARWPQRDDLILGHAQALIGVDLVREALAIVLGRKQFYESFGLVVPITTLLACVQALGQSDRSREALAIIDRLLAKLPNDRELLENRAASLYRLDRYEEALETQRRALSRPGVTRPDELVVLADYLFQVEGPVAARHQLEEVLQAYPGDVEALQAMGRVLASRVRTRNEAPAYYKELLQRDPRSTGRVGWAAVLLDKSHIEWADEQLTQFQQMQPRHRDGRLLRAALLLRRNRPLEARQILNELAAERPMDPDVQLSLAGLATYLGTPYLREAIAAVDRAKTLAPDRPGVQDADVKVNGYRNEFSFTELHSTDTLDRIAVRDGIRHTDGVDKDIGVEIINKRVSRLGRAQMWVDAGAELVWNREEGEAYTFNVRTGDPANIRQDFLGFMEGRWANRSGMWWAVRLYRDRIEDSPEALVAGLTENSQKISAGLRRGRLEVAGGVAHDAINDGNNREIIDLRARYRFAELLTALLDLEQRWSSKPPTDFTLYFAPDRYFTGALGLSLAPLFIGPVRAAVTARAIIDNLAGNELVGQGYGQGYDWNVRLERPMGVRSRLIGELGHEYFSASRRIGNNQPYNLDTVRLAYESQF